MKSGIDTIRRMPGAWLLRIAPRVFDQTVLTSVVHQTIADLRAEWLDAGSSLVGRLRARSLGYLAFWSLVVMAPFVFRKWPGRQIDRRAFWQIRGSSDMAFIRRFRLAAALFVVGLGAGYLVARARPVLYTSSAVIRMIPSQVVPGILDATKLVRTETLVDRLRATTEAILSRSRLEKVILEFNLFEAERQSMPMEEIVGLMRSRLTVTPSDLAPSASTQQIVVSYTGSDPVKVMKVAERFASYVIDESLKDATRRSEGTSAWIQAELDDTEKQLNAAIERERKDQSASVPRRLEVEALETTYRTLLARRTDAYMQVDLNRRQMGEQFILMDSAQVPKQPIGPTRLQVTLMGGAAGLAIAALIGLAASLRRLLRDRRRDLASATT